MSDQEEWREWLQSSSSAKPSGSTPALQHARGGTPSESPRRRAKRAIQQAGRIPKKAGAPPRHAVPCNRSTGNKIRISGTRPKKLLRGRRRASSTGCHAAYPAACARMTPGQTCILSRCSDETLLQIACSVSDAKSLLCFALAYSRVGTRAVSAAICASESSVPFAHQQQPAATEMWSLADEAARQWLRGRSAIEHACTPRRGCESWMGLMHEVQRLRAPPSFGRVYKGIRVKAEDGGQVVVKKQTNADGDATRTAASTVVMRAGKHFVQFRLRNDGQSATTSCVGVVRPDWNVETGHNAQYVRGHCFLRLADGRAFPGLRLWAGMQAAREGDCIGLLLDLHRGEMVVYKNGALLGVMATGLSGKYCWAVATAGKPVPYRYPMQQPPTVGESPGILRLEPAPVPPGLGEGLEAFRG